MPSNVTNGAMSSIILWKAILYQIATFFVLWGKSYRFILRKAENIQVFISPLRPILFIYSGTFKILCFAHILILSTTRNRGLRKSFPRQCLSGIVILMLAASTTHVILGLKFYILQVPEILIPESQPDDPSLVRRLNEYNVAMSWLSRLNVRTSLLTRI